MFGYEENKGPIIRTEQGPARVVYIDWAEYDGVGVTVCYCVIGEPYNRAHFYLGQWSAEYIEKICN